MTVLIIVSPILIMLVLLYMLVRSKKSKGKTKRTMWLIMGFISLTLAYIFYPEPSVAQGLFVQNGDYATPLFYTLLGTSFLFIAIYVFKKHEES